MVQRTTLIADRNYRVGDVDRRLYGSFIEHLGRAVYGGIYQPEHPSADEDGFRQDVLRLVRDLGVTNVSYPGGNYVSNFFWEDSVGPIEQRRARMDLAWRTYEPNRVGIQEFNKWAKKAACDYVKGVKHSRKTINISFDEWNVWYHSRTQDEADLRGFEGYRVAEFLELYNNDLKAVNSVHAEPVRPGRRTDYTQDGSGVSALLAPASLAVIVLRKE